MSADGYILSVVTVRCQLTSFVCLVVCPPGREQARSTASRQHRPPEGGGADRRCPRGALPLADPLARQGPRGGIGDTVDGVRVSRTVLRANS